MSEGCKLPDIDIAKYLPAIKYVMKKAKCSKWLQRADCDDLEQELFFVLSQCAKNYQDDGRAKFLSYAITSMRRYAMGGVSRRMRREKTFTHRGDEWTVKMKFFSEMPYGFLYCRYLATVPPTEDVCDQKDRDEVVGVIFRTALRGLTKRLRQVILMRGGIGQERKTLDEVAKTLGITRERVRQLEARAYLKMNEKVKLQVHSIIDELAEDERRRLKEREKQREEHRAKQAEYYKRLEEEQRQAAYKPIIY